MRTRSTTRDVVLAVDGAATLIDSVKILAGRGDIVETVVHGRTER